MDRVYKVGRRLLVGEKRRFLISQRKLGQKSLPIRCKAVSNFCLHRLSFSDLIKIDFRAERWSLDCPWKRIELLN